MKTAAAEHKIVYVRFHKRVDALLSVFSEKTGMKRAAAVVWIQRRYMERLLADGRPADTVTWEDLGFSGIEEPYFITLGRGREGSMLGRGMQLTVDKSEERILGLVAMQCGMSSRDLRTAMLVQYFNEIGLLEAE